MYVVRPILNTNLSVLIWYHVYEGLCLGEKCQGRMLVYIQIPGHMTKSQIPKTSPQWVEMGTWMSQRLISTVKFMRNATQARHKDAASMRCVVLRKCGIHHDGWMVDVESVCSRDVEICRGECPRLSLSFVYKV